MNKKLTLFMAIAASACITLTAAGCSSSSSNLVALNSNWYTQTSDKTIKPSVIESSGNYGGCEQITYTVSATEGSNGTFSVSYGEGTYTTLFYATEFNYADFEYAKYAPSYADEYAAVENTIYAYYYRTELTMPDVTYTYKSTGAAQNAGDDSIVQECYFLSVGEYLRPLYSKQTIISSSATTYQPTEDDMYTKVDRVYENFYNLGGSELTSVITVNSADQSGDTSRTEKYSAGGTSTTFFDISSLNIAVRALNLSTELSQTIKLISAGSSMADYTVAGSDTETGFTDSEISAIKTELINNGLLDSGAESIDTVAVSISYSATTFSGSSQTMWFTALADDTQNNVSRATLLKMETPLSFSLGSLVYTLKTIDSTF